VIYCVSVLVDVLTYVEIETLINVLTSVVFTKLGTYLVVGCRLSKVVGMSEIAVTVHVVVVSEVIV
jgi:hypothetical protein